MKGGTILPLKRRQKSGTDLYHVIAKGINKERTFNQSREKTYLKKIIKKIQKKYENVEIYAYCIMSNHIHLILKAEFPELSLFMAAVLAEYANYYNYKHHRNGHVFQNRFVSECIETERYFWNCLRYIHLNPVKARVVKEAARYQYSSMMEYKSGTPDILHEKAVAFYKKEFGIYSEFEEFHKQRQRELYIDIPDEVSMQQNEIAFLIAEDLFKTRNLSKLTQVFEESEIRKVYLQELMRTLKISERKAKTIYGIVKKQVEEQKGTG